MDEREMLLARAAQIRDFREWQAQLAEIHALPQTYLHPCAEENC